MVSSISEPVSALPRTQDEWRTALAALPTTTSSGIPAFYFAHGTPILAMDEPRHHPRWGRDEAVTSMDSNGAIGRFLKDFGPALLDKYKPKGIVVFSAHWDAPGDRLVTDYGEENPLLCDYYGYSPEMYRLKFKSRGDTGLSQRVVEALKEAGQPARTTHKLEARGRDGRGYNGPGFDHGVFVPFRLMFGEEFTSVPIVEVSMNGSLRPDDEWALGAAVRALRQEGLLVLSGGLTVHNLHDVSSFSEEHAAEKYKMFDKAVLDAVTIQDPAKRRKAMSLLVAHPHFSAAHSHADHFVPLYIAAGAGGDGNVRVLSASYGGHTYAFGLD